MRVGLSVILGLSLSACAAAADPLPPAFDGVWDVTPAACADPDGVTRLLIAGAGLRWYEWGDDVMSARPDGDGSVRVVLEGWSTDDADANDRPIIRRRTGKLTLSTDRSRLTVATGDAVDRYIRCPKA